MLEHRHGRFVLWRGRLRRCDLSRGRRHGVRLVERRRVRERLERCVYGAGFAIRRRLSRRRRFASGGASGLEAERHFWNGVLARSNGLKTLGVEPALEDHLGSDLIDDRFAILCVASRLVEGALSGESGHAFIPENYAHGGQRCSHCVGEGFYFLSGRPFGSVHVLWEADHDGVDGLFLGYGDDSRKGVRSGGKGFKGMREHAEFI